MPAFNTNVRVYLEGIQIPFNTMSISVAGNTFSTCSIDFPPVKELQNILPRTYVQVFFKDFYDKSPDFTQHMRLLWDGEVAARTFSKTPEARQFRLDCVDLSSYWSYVYGFFSQDISSGFDRVMAMAAGADASSTDTIAKVLAGTANFGDSKFFQILSDRKGEGIDAAIQEIFADSMKLNAFLRNRNRRAKLVEFEATSDEIFAGLSSGFLPGSRTRLKVVPDPEAFGLFEANKLDEIMTMAVSNIAASTDVQSMISRLMEFFFYESWPVVAPPYEAETTTSPSRLVQTMLKPSAYFSAPFQSNILWPELYSHVSYTQNFLSEPTRLRLKTAPTSAVSQGLLQLLIQSMRYDTFAPPTLARILRKVQKTYFESLRPDTVQGGGSPAAVQGSSIPDARTASSTPVTPEDLTKAIQELALPADEVSAGNVLDDGSVTADLQERGAVPSNQTYVVLLSGDVPEESREDRKGIIPGEFALSHYAWQAQMSKKGNLMGNYISRMANYFLGLKQHQRPCAVQGPWNPYVVAGLPGVILDQTLPVFGEFSSISHFVSADGSGTTSIQMEYARFGDAVRYIHPDDLLKDTNDLSSKSRTTPERDIPLWVNAAYRPEFVGEDTFNFVKINVAEGEGESGFTVSTDTADRVGAYPFLFGKGVGSIFKVYPSIDNPNGEIVPGPGTDENPGMFYSQGKAAEVLLDIYDRRRPGEARRRLIQSTQSRPVATMAETLDYLKAVVVNNSELGNDERVSERDRPYREDYQEVVRTVRLSIVAVTPKIERSG